LNLVFRVIAHCQYLLLVHHLYDLTYY
jgi:hypothetical protein